MQFLFVQFKKYKECKTSFFYKSKQQHLIQEDLPQALGMEVTALLGLKGSFFFFLQEPIQVILAVNPI